MNNSNELSPFMKEQLSFRVDQSKLVELSLNKNRDPINTKFILPQILTPTAAFTVLGMYSYFKTRGGSVAHQLVRNRVFRNRLKTMGWGTLSTFSFALAIYFPLKGYSPYEITEA